MRLFIAMFALLMLAACSSIKPQKVQYQANQLKYCPEYLPEVEGNTGADLAFALTQWGAMYHNCKDAHNSLVKSIQEVTNAAK